MYLEVNAFVGSGEGISEGVCMGGTTREDPEYPGILSIPDTVSVRESV